MVLLLAPWGAQAATDMLVGGYFDNTVRRFDGTTGASKGNFVAPGAGGLSGPTGFAFGPDGNFYIASIFNGVIK